MGRSKNTPARMGELRRHQALWRERFDNGDLGVPDQYGEAVVVYSVFGGLERAFLRRHADSLVAKWRASRTAKAVIDVCANPSLGDLTDIIQNPNISTIAFLGHGSMGSVWLFEGKKHRNVSWYDVASMVTHLKTGTFEQRTCVGAVDGREARVPVGTFLMADQRRVLIPACLYLPNETGFSGFDLQMAPIFRQPHNTPEELLAAIPKQV